ncbi:unnamed protein product [Heligmosomoides polygyrus]|uniref:Uncharacterized protein n=1 Tax=Heligmosomoides polygyrus TaxID=6339 RepID=A0A183GD57_HELPZ|nr:unnamed protein product [Heligmosomoides polygyrus]
MRLLVLLTLLLLGYSSDLVGAQQAQMTNDFRRFTQSENTYLFPYLVRRLPFPRLILKANIINQLKRAHIIKY